jgi:hypothetical protein
MGESGGGVMKGFKFYAVMPNDRKSKSASKAYPFDPFTRRRLQEKANAGGVGECLALSIDDHGGRSWRYNPEAATCGLDFEQYGPTHITMNGVSLEYLAARCVLISEELARLLHPALFEYLES